MSTEETRKVIQDWMAANDTMGPRKAYEKFCVADVIGHNPTAGQGSEAIAYIEDEFSRGLKLTVHRMIVDGDFGAVHMHFTFTDGSPDLAIVDVWRVENGKLAEIWDVQQVVPKTTVSGNSMF